MISSMDDDSLLELGTIGRPHGTRGEVVVRLVTNRTERLDTGSRLLSSEGELVVESSRPHQDKFLVRFEGFSSRTEAEQLRGVTLKGFPLDTPDVLWVHKLIGAQVVEIDGTDRGTVVSVIANPASDLLELEDGHLVPLTFVTDFDSNIVHVVAPDGLFDLS